MLAQVSEVHLPVVTLDFAVDPADSRPRCIKSQRAPRPGGDPRGDPEGDPRVLEPLDADPSREKLRTQVMHPVIADDSEGRVNEWAYPLLSGPAAKNPGSVH